MYAINNIIFSSWPAWEMNDHDLVQGVGRFPEEVDNCLFIIALLLPGTGIIYYGDEIGMNNNTGLNFSNTKDPYVKEYCNEVEFNNGQCLSRDPSRTPMQVSDFGDI